MPFSNVIHPTENQEIWASKPTPIPGTCSIYSNLPSFMLKLFYQVNLDYYFLLIGCPPGLEYFSTVDQMHVVQKKNMKQALTGWDTNIKYSAFNQLGQQMMYIMEKSSGC